MHTHIARHTHLFQSSQAPPAEDMPALRHADRTATALTSAPGLEAKRTLPIRQSERFGREIRVRRVVGGMLVQSNVLLGRERWSEGRREGQDWPTCECCREVWAIGRVGRRWSAFRENAVQDWKQHEQPERLICRRFIAGRSGRQSRDLYSAHTSQLEKTAAHVCDPRQSLAKLKESARKHERRQMQLWQRLANRRLEKAAQSPLQPAPCVIFVRSSEVRHR